MTVSTFTYGTVTQESVEDYLFWEKERGVSVHDLRKQKLFMKSLLDWFFPDKELSLKNLTDWRNSLEKRGYSSATVHNYVKGINRYLNYIGCDELKFPKGKAKELTGRKFGYLTAVEKTAERNRHNVVWKCKCDCGNWIELPATRLLMENTMSCGCMRKEQLQKANQYIDKTNLRQSLNNQIVSSHSSSGYTGVARKRDKWQAYINYKGKRYFLGCYEKLEDAVDARSRAKQLVQEDAQRLKIEYDKAHLKDAGCIS